MTITEGLAKIKAMFEAIPAVEPVTEATEYTLADGVTKVMIDKLEVGGSVTVGGEAANDMEHTLQDGIKITTVGGLITLVTPKEEAPTDLSSPEKMGVALQKFADEAGADVQPLVKIVKALFENVFSWDIRQAKEKATKDEAIALYQAGFTKQQDVIKEMFSVMEKFAEEPQSKPLDFTTQKKWEEMTALEKRQCQREK